MKRTRLFIGILVGGIFACIGLVIFSLAKPDQKGYMDVAGNNVPGQWDWPSSLDALVAAPAFHRLIFENDDMRILEVIVNPGQVDPVHTHKGKSIVWVVKSSPIVYTTFTKGKGNKLVPIKKDTIIIAADDLNKANWENPEPPHSVENIGTDTFKLYRIEYKK